MYKRIMCIILIFLLLISITGLAAKENGETKFVTADATDLDLLSCRFTQLEPEKQKINLSRLNTEGYVVLLENKNYTVFFNENNCNIRVADNKTGYIWGTITDRDYDYLSDSWIALGNALVTIKYLDEQCMSHQASVNEEGFVIETLIEDNSVLFAVDNSNIGISFKFKVVLYSDNLSISFVEGSLKERGDFVLESLYFMPFFGSTKADEIDGYMFIPDGSGALIRYSESVKTLAPYDKRIYGLDMATDVLEDANDLRASRTNDYLTESKQVTIPVFGVVHGSKSNAFLAVVDDGAEYASIYASPAGYVTDYNWITARFDFRKTYMQALRKDGGGIQVNQRIPNKIAPSVSYYFLTGDDADYSGMAVKYRSVLKENEVLSKEERVDSNIPLQLDVLAADVKKGKIFRNYINMTTVSEAEEIYNRLLEKDISNLTFLYKGWKKGGLNGGSYLNINFDSRLADVSELVALKDKIISNNGRFYLAINPITANEDQIKYKQDSALTIARKCSSFYRDNDNIPYKYSYVLQPKLVLEFLEECTLKYDEFNFAVDGLGYRAYGNYDKNNYSLRNKTINSFKKAAEKYMNNLALNKPNQYMWNITDDYFELPLENSQYLYETDSVPFLSILLKGSVDYYSPYINQGYYTEDSILKMIEYGAYPSFFVMNSENNSLQGTPSEDYFSLNFSDWEDAIEKTYKQMDEILKYVEGAEIKKHTVINTGLISVEYSNDYTIYINYNSKSVTLDDGNVIKPKSSICVKEVKK